jgi:hypothetical protein
MADTSPHSPKGKEQLVALRTVLRVMAVGAGTIAKGNSWGQVFWRV